MRHGFLQLWALDIEPATEACQIDQAVRRDRFFNNADGLEEGAAELHKI